MAVRKMTDDGRNVFVGKVLFPLPSYPPNIFMENLKSTGYLVLLDGRILLCNPTHQQKTLAENTKFLFLKMVFFQDQLPLFLMGFHREPFSNFLLTLRSFYTL